MKSREAQLNDIGTGFDLDQTTLAYEIGGQEVHWMDYSDDSEAGWDMDSYYKDFDNWFVCLDKEMKERIVETIAPDLYARLPE